MSPRSKSITIRNLAFRTAGGKEIFSGLSGSFGRGLTGLVGRNGVGKTTLLRVIVGELPATEGSVVTEGSVGYLPQNFSMHDEQNVGDFLAGAGAEWEEEYRALRSVAAAGLDIPLGRKLGTLSGGERVRLNLARLLLGRPEFLLLDEPTNNLDANSRKALYRLLETTSAGVLVVTHDRELLRRAGAIAEMTKRGLDTYGGNYDLYLEEKKRQAEALERRITTKELEIGRAEDTARAALERNEKRGRVGKIHAIKANLPKIVRHAWKNAAESNAGTSRVKHLAIVEGLHGELDSLKARRRPENTIAIELPGTGVPAGKRVVDLRDVAFGHPGGKRLFSGFTFAIQGPQRVAIRGGNGTGKTTLARLILGELWPQAGSVHVGVESTAYLDQFANRLPAGKSLVEIIRDANPKAPESEARTYLARLRFAREEAFKPMEVLSGGERLRLLLAREFFREAPPQLVVLDEPTNNLDLDSIERIESALDCYRGALIVISHDEDFLRNVGVDREIPLS